MQPGLDLPRGPRRPVRRSPEGLILPPHAGEISIEAASAVLAVQDRRRAAAAAPFTPADLGASLLTWWDPASSVLSVNADGSGGTPAAGAAVGRVSDKSSSGLHLTAPDATSRPILTANAGPSGLAALSFNGSFHKLITASFGSAETHYFLVLRHAATFGGVFGRTIGGAYDWLYRPSGDTVLANFGAPRGGVGVQLNNSALWPATTVWGLYRLSIVPGTSPTVTVDVRRDGVSYASSTATIGSNTWNAPFGLGSTEVAGSSNWGQVVVGETLICGALTSTQIGQVEAYLKARWGTP